MIAEPFVQDRAALRCDVPSGDEPREGAHGSRLHVFFVSRQSRMPWGRLRHRTDDDAAQWAPSITAARAWSSPA